MAVQGYGNVGSATATILHGMGRKIVAVSDVSGGLYCPRGLDIPGINRHVAAHPQHLLEGYSAPGVEKIGNEDLLTSEVDVLIPAALEQQVRADNAPLVQASMVVEAANAGGVVVSYFEWAQDLQAFFWDEEEVNKNLERLMVQAFDEVWSCSREWGIPLRLGANMLAVDRVASAIRSRGIFP